MTTKYKIQALRKVTDGAMGAFEDRQINQEEALVKFEYVKAMALIEILAALEEISTSIAAVAAEG